MPALANLTYVAGSTTNPALFASLDSLISALNRDVAFLWLKLLDLRHFELAAAQWGLLGPLRIAADLLAARVVQSVPGSHGLPL